MTEATVVVTITPSQSLALVLVQNLRSGGHNIRSPTPPVEIGSLGQDPEMTVFAEGITGTENHHDLTRGIENPDQETGGLAPETDDPDLETNDRDLGTSDRGLETGVLCPVPGIADDLTDLKGSLILTSETDLGSFDTIADLGLDQGTETGLTDTIDDLGLDLAIEADSTGTRGNLVHIRERKDTTGDLARGLETGQTGTNAVDRHLTKHQLQVTPVPEVTLRKGTVEDHRQGIESGQQKKNCPV